MQQLEKALHSGKIYLQIALDAFMLQVLRGGGFRLSFGHVAVIHVLKKLATQCDFK
jgi:hypothetical protein